MSRYRSIYNIPLRADIPAFLAQQGVPLNTPLMPNDTGYGPIPHMGIGAVGRRMTQQERNEAWALERSELLYRFLEFHGYFDTPVAERRPLAEVLGVDPPRPFAWSRYMSIPDPAPAGPVRIPIGYAGNIQMKRQNLNLNAISQDEFVDGEKVNVIYSEDQVKKLNRGEHVNIKPSMIFKTESIDSLLKQGITTNPFTREKIGLRERRTLRFRNANNSSAAGAGASQGGKRKNRKAKKSRKTYRKSH